MLRNLFALTEQGAKDMKKGIIASIFSSLSLMFPMGLLLMLVMQLLQPLLGIEADGPSLKLYSVLCIGLLLSLIHIFPLCHLSINSRITPNCIN